MIRIISNLICDKINIQTVWHDNTVRTHVHATFMLKKEIWRFLSSSLIFGFGSSILSFLYGPHWHWHMRNEYTCTRVILQVLAPFLHDHVLSLHPFVHRYTSTSIAVVVLPLPNSYTVARTRRHSESSHCIWHRIRIVFFPLRPHLRLLKSNRHIPRGTLHVCIFLFFIHVSLPSNLKKS